MPAEQPDAVTDLYVERLRRALKENLGKLSGIESEILTRRFVPGGGSMPPLREIGEAVGLTKERVRQIQKVAIEKLRRALATDPVLR